MIKRKLNEIEYILLHCSDSDIESHDDIEIIKQWHLENGWSDIGYNYVITKDGVPHYGRSIFNVGAHAKGYNRNSIGICLTGRNEFSIHQEQSLFNLVLKIMKDYKIKKILYHRDVTKGKTCPNFSWDWIDRINEAIQAEKI